MKLFVVGGAGYIGSHFYRHARSLGHEVCVLDNFSTGFRESLPADAQIYEVNLKDTENVKKALLDFRPDVVLHYAAYSFVGESCKFPEKYFDNNVGGMKSLLKALEETTPLPVVFSSTCAVYGNPESIPVNENEKIAPMSPYGETKVECEAELKKYCEANMVGAFALRYFNACGADPKGDIGESHFPTQRLISSIFKAINDGVEFTMFGDDFDTRDGTCIRDYIHVLDLADAHIKAAEKLGGLRSLEVVNLGTGQGTSNKEIFDAVEKQLNTCVKYQFGPRRDGDPARLFADCSKANSVLDFEAKHSSLENIIETAAKWHLEFPNGYLHMKN